MPRPPLVIGTWGKIRRRQIDKGSWTAYARYRDHDGVTRLIERTAGSGQKAEDALKTALTQRLTLTEDDITAESTIKAVGEVWFRDEIEGQKALNTERRYREILDGVVFPGIGGVRMREVSVSRLDRFLKLTASNRGNATAIVTKTVLSGLVGMAARHGALASNPLRDVASIKKNKKTVRALSLEQLWDLRSKMYANELAVLRDVPEPIDFMLGTAVRIGEVLATRWPDLNLGGGKPTFNLHATVVWVNGRGMVIQEHRKSSDEGLQLILPSFVVDMLERRREEQAPNELGLVFPSERGTIRAPANFRKQWRQLREEIDYEWVVPHTFRKTVATLTDDPHLASQQLGHSDLEVTNRHYIVKSVEGPDLRPVLDTFVHPSFTHRKQRGATDNDDDQGARTTA